MNSSATDVIVARSREVDRLSAMLMWSIGAHVVVTAIMLVMPHGAADTTPREVMTITLGGAPGPRTGGLTQMGARPVQAAEPPQAVKRPETAPAPTKPAMTLPDPRAKPQQTPKNAPRDTASKTPTTGEQPREGTARAETRVRGQGFGLSTAGGGGGGVTVDAVNFCCNEYILTMIERIRTNWNQRSDMPGVPTVKFTIHRDGTIEEPVQVERSSGFAVLDNEAVRALRLTRLPPLPAQYTNQTLTVHLEFEYVRR
jgi:protein TonB